MTTPGPREAPQLSALKARVDRALGEFLTARREAARTAAGGDTALPMLEEVAAELITRGGKRLRALFCLLGWTGAGSDQHDESAVRAAAALELLHGCALIHDDVMDGSATRRGGPSVHQVFAAAHRAAGWRGDPARFGTAAAIAAGDLCLTWADMMLRDCGLPAAAIERARPVYDAMRAETIRGQYHDLLAQARGGAALDEALAIMREKTAACTTRGPLVFGGALADAPAALLARYEALGETLGEAFQMRDDLLGAYGDSSATGKPSGDDLRDGKCTVLLAEAHRLSDEPGRARLAELAAQGTDAAVERLRLLIEDCGAREAVEKFVRECCDRARRELTQDGLRDTSVREPLETLIGLVAGA